MRTISELAVDIWPLFDRILVQRHEAESESPGGILLPDAVKERPRKGTVLAVACGGKVEGKLHEFFVKQGDTVLFGAYAGSEVEDEDLVIMREEDVLAICQGVSDAE